MIEHPEIRNNPDWRRGYQAYCNGVSRDGNIDLALGERLTHWLAGWDDACKDNGQVMGAL